MLVYRPRYWILGCGESKKMFFFEAVFTKICLICYHLFYVSDPLPNFSAGRVLLTCGQFIPWVFCHTYLVPRALSNRFQDG